jgi:hypothetical protein
MTKHSRFISNGFRLAALALAVAGSGNAIAATTNASSTSTVIAAINITKSADLAFGSFVSSVAGGSVTITPGGTRTATGVTAIPSTATAAKFDVTGESGMGYTISITPTSLTNGSGGAMTFNPIVDLTASASTTANATAGSLTGGAQSIYVGGVLAVGASQAAGSYSGNITALVEYN